MTEGLYPEEDLKGLSTDLVSPGVVAPAAESAPTRTVLLAGAGAFEQAHVTMTRGIYVGTSGAAQYHREVAHPARVAVLAPAQGNRPPARQAPRGPSREPAGDPQPGADVGPQSRPGTDPIGVQTRVCRRPRRPARVIM